MPIHINAGKDDIINFKKGKPIIKGKKKKTKPSICYIYCPFCRKIFNRTNVYKNSNHFESIHQKTPMNVKQQLLDIIRLKGLNLYRKVQIMSIYKKSNNEKEKEKLNDILEGNSIVHISERFRVRLPKIKLDMDENPEIETLIFDSVNKNIIFDYIDSFVLNDNNENEINNVEFRSIIPNINYYEEFNKLNENEERTVSEKELFFEKIIILSQLLQHDKNSLINELIDQCNEKERMDLFKNVLCYSMATLGFTKRQSDFFNTSLKIYSKVFGIDKNISISYSSCHRKWLCFLETVKESIKRLNKTCDCFSFMLDETSQYNVNTIMLIANYKFGNSFCKKLIKIESFDESTTSENIMEWINRQLIYYEFDCSKFKGICTDGAPSMMKLCTELGNKFYDNNFISIHCFCHRLNIAISHVMDCNNCEVVKNIISWFESSNVLTQFKKYIKPIKINSPPMNCPTRWEYYVKSVDYILNNVSTIEEFLNQTNTRCEESISKIRKSLVEKTNKYEDKPIIEENAIKLGGVKNKVLSLFVALSIILNEVKLASKVLQNSSVSLSNGLRVIVCHIKRLYLIKNELESKNNISIMKKYFEYCKSNKCEVDENILKLVNDFILNYNELFTDIFGINKKMFIHLGKCDSFDCFMNKLLFCNLNNKFFQYFVFENVDLFQILNKFKNSCSKKINYNEYLQFQVINPSTSNVERMFSVFKHHYHPNSLDITVESTVNCGFNSSKIEPNEWTYQKKHLLEETLENIERKREK